MKIKTNIRAGSGGVDNTATTVDTSTQTQNQKQNGGGGGGGNTVVSYVPPVYVGRCVGI